MAFKTKVKVKNVDGTETESEVEIPQEQIDPIITQRLAREKEKHAEEVSKLNKEIADRDKAINDSKGANTAEVAKLQKTTEELNQKFQETSAKTRLLTYVTEKGIKLPKLYLDSIKVSAEESDADFESKVKAVEDKYAADLKTYAPEGTPAPVRQQVGSTASGASQANQTAGDAELLALIPKYPKLAFLAKANLTEQEKVATIKRMKEAGQLDRLIQEPVKK